ncbi:peptide-methionine (S)-S-oxide reductase MsrA [Hirschia maritima]|uniref:peptide-methionine (S)-S-oxide reductase MsrA n=1 Tax=Hirschia maritima TaxID=1121961 RepID=UPI0003772359|nr:peptide-methionine (S)-S-oxide reductase MsrA [Hirschia maritima]
MGDLDKSQLVPEEKALKGRDTEIVLSNSHFLNDRPLKGSIPNGFGQIYLGLGCFWGAERRFWETEGVYVTSVGYQGGFTPNPTYEEVCSGQTGHAEIVHVVFDPSIISLEGVLKVFWEAHDPTQGMRQGNDLGTQYRSAVYAINEADLKRVEASKAAYQSALNEGGRGDITTEIKIAGPYYYAEEYHQQYLAKNPEGYCGLKGTGVECI